MLSFTPPSVSDLKITTVSCTVTPIAGRTFTLVVDRDADDPLTQSFLAGIYPSLEIFHRMKRITPAGSRILDLGGHIGALSLASAADGYDVVTVEASPRNAALLQASVEANHWKNIRIVHAGVSSAPGTLSFIVDGPYGRVATGNDAKTVTVPALTVDSLLSEIGWERPDFIKMDIEGSEVAAIKGMAGLLARSDAPPIYLESNGHTLWIFEETPNSLKRAIESFGYRNYMALPDGYVSVLPDDVQGATVVDYLAVKSAPTGFNEDIRETALSEEKIAAELREAGASPVIPHRLYALRTLAHAPETLLARADLQAMVARLRTDEAEEVRSAAALVKLPPVVSKHPSWLSSLFKR